jgi:WD40 repeat protein
MRFPGRRVTAMSFGADGDAIIIGVSDRSLHYWPLHTDAGRWSLDGIDVTTIAGASSSRKFYVGAQTRGMDPGQGGSVHGFTFSGEAVYVKEFKDDTPSSLAWSEDAQVLAVGSGWGNVDLISMSGGGDPKSLIRDHRYPVLDLSFSSDGRWLAIGRWDGFLLCRDSNPDDVVVYEEKGQRFKLCRFLHEARDDGKQSDSSEVCSVSSRDDSPECLYRRWRISSGKLVLTSTQVLAPTVHAVLALDRRTLFLSHGPDLFRTAFERE